MSANDRSMDQECPTCGFKASGLYAYAEMRKHIETHEWWQRNITEQDKDFLKVNRIVWE